MTEQQISSLMLVAIGGFFLLRNIMFYRDEEKFKAYLENSRKAKFWISKFGFEKTEALSKKYFLPLGILIAAIILLAGIFGLTGKSL